jgi:hypothetical protein
VIVDLFAACGVNRRSRVHISFCVHNRTNSLKNHYHHVYFVSEIALAIIEATYMLSSHSTEARTRPYRTHALATCLLVKNKRPSYLTDEKFQASAPLTANNLCTLLQAQTQRPPGVDQGLDRDSRVGARRLDQATLHVESSITAVVTTDVAFITIFSGNQSLFLRMRVYIVSHCLNTPRIILWYLH